MTLANAQAVPGSDATQSVRGVCHVRLVDFRNYERLDLETSSQQVVLTGANGAGKTNILEALSFLSPGRGLRRASLPHVARLGASGRGWGVRATLAGLGHSGAPTLVPTVLGTGLRPAETKRSWHIEDQAVRSALALADHVRLLWFVPEMGRLFSEGPAGRRRFLDRMVFAFEPEHALVVARYEHHLRERWLVLKHDQPSRMWLEHMESMLVDDAVMMAQRRLSMCHLLNHEAPRDSEFPDVGLSVEGPFDRWLQEHGEDEARALLRQSFEQNRSDDRHSGGAKMGPHKSDLVMTHREKNRCATLCSTGEQKILLVSSLLKYAALWGRHSRIPLVLLLDDVAAHLDEQRRQALFREVSQHPVQTWLTGAESSIFTPLQGQACFFHVENGRINPYDGANT